MCSCNSSGFKNGSIIHSSVVLFSDIRFVWFSVTQKSEKVLVRCWLSKF